VSNGIDKKALFKLKSEPYLKPISDLGVGFYNLDENTAILRFQLSNSKGPLLIHENNLTAYAYFESSNESASDVVELNVEDSFNGIVTITLDKAFLQASTSTKVTGQVFIGVNNVDGDEEYNEVAVFREFTFQVADALINKISSFTKIEYIRMFDQLKTHIEQRVNDIEQAIANGADYVAEMKTAKEQGIAQINQTVTDSKNYIDNVIAQAQTSIDETSSNAISDVEISKTDAINSITNKVSEGNSNVNNVVNNATTHVDNKLTEFNQAIEENEFIRPESLESKLNTLQWQKYKFTENNGSRMYLKEINYDITTLEPGHYMLTYASNANWSTVNTPDTIDTRVGHIAMLDVYKDTANRKQFIYWHSSKCRMFIATTHSSTSFSGWKELTSTQSDTGWVPFQLINGASTNASFKGENDNGFDCAYRIVTNGTVPRKSIRFNGRNLTQGQIIAQLPTNLFKNAHTFPIRVPTSASYYGGYITARPSGQVNFYINGDSSAWTETGYIYGEYTWTD
jgi:F0F1-type ATP synthase membrane subunit b/b'